MPNPDVGRSVCPHCGHSAGDHSNAREDDFGCQVEGCKCYAWLPSQRPTNNLIGQSGSSRAADPNCPSCGGVGWATIREGGITYATGACRCVGGNVWRNPIRENVENVTREARDGR